ncbi:MAG: hypothetical protein K2F91_08050, partial [Muribaculaceae bacterium]|nr:hypothetical protein [Muribaculaceae bacterium]
MPDSTAAHTDSIPAYAPVPPAESYELPTGFTADSIVSTVLVDSIGRDTITGRIPHFIPVAEADSLRAKALMDSLGTHSALPEIPSGASEGLPPVAVTPSASTSTPLTALLMG